MSVTVFDHTQTPQLLDAELARGGEGAVYPLAHRQDILVKLYHPNKLSLDGAELQAKIEAMIAVKQDFIDDALSWPLLSVFDDKRQWQGYAMKRANGVPMTKLAHACLYTKYFPQLDRSGLVKILLNYLDAVERLHSKGIFIGDFNLNNAMCHPADLSVTLIDCDSVQFSAKGRVFPCCVGSPDLTPVEHLGRAFKDIQRNRESDCFSLAIILFKCLMLGRHPYDIVGGADPVGNMRQGNFPYGRGARGLPPGHWYNIWSHMPFRLKNLFIQVFTEGVRTPAARPDLPDWRDALQVYLKEMRKGWHETAIKPAHPKSSEHRGNSKSQVSVAFSH